MQPAILRGPTLDDLAARVTQTELHPASIARWRTCLVLPGRKHPIPSTSAPASAQARVSEGIRVPPDTGAVGIRRKGPTSRSSEGIRVPNRSRRI